MTIYYVDGAVGNDSNLGTSEGVGNAWATIDKAMNTVAAGDTVYVKASAIYDENGIIDTAGTLGLPISFIGYSSTTTDNGKVTWTNSAGSALTDSILNPFYAFSNFKFDGCSADGVAVDNYFKFVNCEFTNNTGDGIACDGTNMSFYKCIFSGNSFHGIDFSGLNDCLIAGCIFHSNTRQAIEMAGSGGTIYKSLFYNNGTAGYNIIGGANDYVKVLGCTVDGDGTTGDLIALVNESAHAIIDCILYDGDRAYSSTDSAGPATFLAIYSNNLLNGNTSNDYYVNAASLTGPGIGVGDVTSAPAFTDEANDDYTLDNASPAIGKAVIPGGIT